MNPLVKFVTQRYLFIAFFMFAIGLLLEYWGGQYELRYQKISVVADGKVEERDVFIHAEIVPILRAASAFALTLAASIFVSVYVIKGIEEYQKRGFENELESLRTRIRNDIFDGVYKTMMPAELYEVFLDSIIRRGLVRRNSRWLFDFSKGGGDPGEMMLRQRLSSDLCNECSTVYDQEYPFVVKTADDSTVLESLKVEKDGKVVAKISGQTTESEELIRTVQSSDGCIKHFVRVVIEPRAHVSVTAVFKTPYRTELVCDAYFSVEPMIGAELTVSHPLGYEFSILESTSSPLELLHRDTTKSIYRMKGAALPYQGLMFYLKPICIHPSPILRDSEVRDSEESI